MDERKLIAVNAMIDCHPNSTVTDAMLATYLEAVDKYPANVVEQTCSDFRHGRDDRKNPDFVPSPPVFARHLSKVNAAFHRDQAGKAQRLAIESQQSETLTDDQRAENEAMRQRIGEKMRHLADALRGSPVVPFRRAKPVLEYQPNAALLSDLEQRKQNPIAGE